MELRFGKVLSKEVKQEGGALLASQLMEVELGLYFEWPDVYREYLFPKFGLHGEIEWVCIKGGVLLEKAYRTLPSLDPGTATYEDYGRFFDSAVAGAVTDVLSSMDNEEIRTTRRHEIDSLIKARLLDQPGDVFYRLGIPAECLGITIRRIAFEDGTVKAFGAPEIAQREARAAVETARGQKEAASFQSLATREILQAYIDLGVPAELAGFLATGRLQAGEGMSITEFRDLAIAMTIRGPSTAKPPTPIVHWLDNLTPEELERLAEVKARVQR